MAADWAKRQASSLSARSHQPVLHLSDIAFTIIGGFTEILWIVLLASLVQTALLLYYYLHNRRLPLAQDRN